jgi:hypothetical protein
MQTKPEVTTTITQTVVEVISKVHDAPVVVTRIVALLTSKIYLWGGRWWNNENIGGTTVRKKLAKPLPRLWSNVMTKIKCACCKLLWGGTLLIPPLWPILFTPPIDMYIFCHIQLLGIKMCMLCFCNILMWEGSIMYPRPSFFFVVF